MQSKRMQRSHLGLMPAAPVQGQRVSLSYTAVGSCKALCSSGTQPTASLWLLLKAQQQGSLLPGRPPQGLAAPHAAATLAARSGRRALVAVRVRPARQAPCQVHRCRSRQAPAAKSPASACCCQTKPLSGRAADLDVGLKGASRLHPWQSGRPHLRQPLLAAAPQVRCPPETPAPGAFCLCNVDDATIGVRRSCRGSQPFSCMRGCLPPNSSCCRGSRPA